MISGEIGFTILIYMLGLVQTLMLMHQFLKEEKTVALLMHGIQVAGINYQGGRNLSFNCLR